MIALRGFSVALGGHTVLKKIEFSAGPGEFVAICGPNGAGKTTFLRALAGLLPGTRKPDPKHVAYLEQGARCAWGLRIAEIAALGRIPHGDTDEAAIARALRTCGIEALAGRRIDTVSGGQARRAMLARAFATEPETMLLDEPVADLDPFAAHEILARLAEFASGGALVVAVLHAVDLALLYATRMVVIADGRIMADAPPLAALPAAAQSFGLTFGIDPTPRVLAPKR